MDPLQIWWDLAGPSAFFDRIVRELGKGERVICIAAPEPRPDGFGDALERRLRSELSLDCVRLDVSGADRSQPIPHCLAEMLDVSASDIGTVSDFASHPDLGDHIVIADGLKEQDILRWSLFMRSLAAEKAGTTIVGPILVLMIPAGLDRLAQAQLCGPIKPLSVHGLIDRFDSIAYLSRLGYRPGHDLVARVGHAVAVDVAAWSRDVLVAIASRPAADQVDPMGILTEASAGAGPIKPSWSNGLIDLWDDEPVVHAVAAVANGYANDVKARIWSGQSNILLPFTYRILRFFVSRYRSTLDQEVSPQRPLRRQFGKREFVYDSPDQLEFWDVLSFLKAKMSDGEQNLLEAAARARHAMAHRDPMRASELIALSDHYEANRHSLVSDLDL